MRNEYIGNDVQLFDVREYTFASGKSKGTRAVDIWNGKGLSVTLLPDRCLDVYTVRFNNHNMAYHTANGVVAPAYYNEQGIAFLRSFAAGFLTTCGLKNYGVGDPDDQTYTFHGRIGHTPAENYGIDFSEDGKKVRIHALMRESMIFGYNFTLKRTFEMEYGKDEIRFTDEVKNEGYTESHLSMLYHFNMGYPLLSENAKIVIPTKKTVPGTDHAKQYPDSWDTFTKPEPVFEEMLFEHELEKKEVGIDNRDINTSLRIKFDSPVLDHFLEWKACQAGTYVCGLEPMTATNSGHKANEANGTQKRLAPGESVTNTFVITFDTVK